jgi:hypothetical protein
MNNVLWHGARRRRVVLAILVVVISVISVQAAGAASDPRVPALQRKVAALNEAVVELQRVVTTQSQMLQRAIDTETCHYVYQFHINVSVYNIFATLIGVAPYNGGVPSDGGACQRIGVATPYAFMANSPLAGLGAMIGASLAR